MRERFDDLHKRRRVDHQPGVYGFAWQPTNSKAANARTGNRIVLDIFKYKEYSFTYSDK